MIHMYAWWFLCSQHMFTIKVLSSLCKKHISLHLDIKEISLIKGWFMPLLSNLDALFQVWLNMRNRNMYKEFHIICIFWNIKFNWFQILLRTHSLQNFKTDSLNSPRNFFVLFWDVRLFKDVFMYSMHDTCWVNHLEI